MSQDLAAPTARAAGQGWSPTRLLVTALALFLVSVAAGALAFYGAAAIGQTLGWVGAGVRLDFPRVELSAGIAAGTVVFLFTAGALATQSVLLAGGVLPAKRASGLPLREAIGWRAPERLPAGLLLGFALLVALYAFAANGVLATWYGQGAERWAFAAMGTVAIPYFVVLCVGAPLVEEILFRGWLLTGLLRSWKPRSAIAVSGLLWADLHLFEDPLKAILLFAPGVFFAWLRVRTGSVWPSVLLHMVLNSFAILLTLLG